MNKLQKHGGSKYLKAYDYPKVSSTRSSDTPSAQLTGKLTRSNIKQTNLIRLAEGDVSKLGQLGGSINQRYNNITNPETGRKVDLFGKKGKQILKNYLQNLTKY